MQKSVIVGLLIIVGVVAIWWMAGVSKRGAPSPPSAPVPGEVAVPTPLKPAETGGKSVRDSVASASTAEPNTATQEPSDEPIADVAPDSPQEDAPWVPPAEIDPKVASVLTELHETYGFAGELNWDETKALVAKRKEKSAELEKQLSELGPGGAKSLGDAYGTDIEVRDKMLLIAALGKINDSEAVAILAGMFDKEKSFSLQKEILDALGNRNQEAESVLSDMLKTEEDPRVRFAAVQQMKFEGAVVPLTSAVRTDSDHEVRLEAIHSLGDIGSAPAQESLSGVANDASLELAVRESAIKELGRSFGEGAVGALGILMLSDANEAVRLSAVNTISRISSPQSRSLLQQAAGTDSSESVRNAAAAAAASMNVPAS